MVRKSNFELANEWKQISVVRRASEILACSVRVFGMASDCFQPDFSDLYGNGVPIPARRFVERLHRSQRQMVS